MKVSIIEQEMANDGQSVFLYYDTASGKYLAYGLSAYYADMAASPKLSFSSEYQMPVAVLERKDVLDLRQSMTMIAHTPYVSYRFKTRQLIGREGYERWAGRITI